MIFSRRWSTMCFALPILLCLGCFQQTVSDVPARRAARGETIPLQIKAREFPVQIEPIPGLEDCVTDKQLLDVLSASLPLWHPPTVPSLIHEFRLWGQSCDFSKEVVGGQGRTGSFLRDTLLSDSLCKEHTTPFGNHFLIDSPYGIHVVRAGSKDAVDFRAEGHYGQLLMVLAETSTPLSTPVSTDTGSTGTIANLLQDAIFRYSPGNEQEFITVALACWLAPNHSWEDQYGDKHTFDDLAVRLTNMQLGEGCCGGCHAPYALTILLRVNELYPIISKGTKRKIETRLKEISAALERAESENGRWDNKWPMNGASIHMYEDETMDRINVMGHHLEWIALVPVSLRPSKETIIKIVTLLHHSVNDLPPMSRRSRTFKSLLPCSHAARALCLFRRVDPNQVWWDAWNGQKIKKTNKGYEYVPVDSPPNKISPSITLSMESP